MNDQGLTLRNMKRDLGIKRPLDYVRVLLGAALLAVAMYVSMVGLAIIGELLRAMPN